MTDMRTLGGTPVTGALPVGSIQDMASHPANKLPAPGFAPAMKHSTAMAGSVLSEGGICKAQAMK